MTSEDRFHLPRNFNYSGRNHIERGVLGGLSEENLARLHSPQLQLTGKIDDLLAIQTLEQDHIAEQTLRREQLALGVAVRRLLRAPFDKLAHNEVAAARLSRANPWSTPAGSCSRP